MTKIELYITIGLVVMLIVGLIGSKITQKKISRDPERQRKIEERARAYREQLMEEQELNDIASSFYEEGLTEDDSLDY